MFRRFNRLMPLPGKNKYEMLYYKSKYNFTPNLPTLSLYGDIMSYLFKDPKKPIKYIYKPNLKIPYDEQWECKDFKKTTKRRLVSTIPYEEQWEVRDFYVRNKNINKNINIDKYIEKKKKDENRGFDLVILDGKTITYNNYIQQLFLLDKKNRCK